MLGVGVDHPFPWVTFTTLTKSTNTVFSSNGNHHIVQSNFYDINDNSAIKIDGSYSCFVDKTSFSNCRSDLQDLDGSCINFNFQGNNGIFISRTVASECTCRQGTFIFSKGEKNDSGMQEMILVSIDRCPGSYQSSDVFHSALIQFSKIRVSNLNNTRCNVKRHFAISLYYSILTEVKFMNIADNSCQENCGFSAIGNADVRRCNFIKNREGQHSNEAAFIRGIIMSRGSETVMTVYDSVITGNTYDEYLFFGEGVLTLNSCKLQSKDYGTYQSGNVNFVNERERPIVTMTLYASRDIHAEMPLRSFCTRPILSRSRPTLVIACFVFFSG